MNLVLYDNTPPIDQFSESQMNSLLIINQVTSFITFWTCVTMIVFYFRFRVLQNFYTAMFFYLSIGEIVYCIGKFFSIGRFFYGDKGNKPICYIQAFLVISGELIALSWIVIIVFNMYKMLIDHIKFSSSELKKYFLITLVFPILLNTILISFFLYTDETKEKKSCFCWIKGRNDHIDDDKAYDEVSKWFLWAVYLIYFMIIFVNIYFYCKLNAFLREWSNSNLNSENSNSEHKLIVTRLLNQLSRMCIIVTIAYFIGLFNRLFFYVCPLCANSQFILFVISCSVNNLKYNLYYFLCLDVWYRKAIWYYLSNGNFFFLFYYNKDNDFKDIFKIGICDINEFENENKAPFSPENVCNEYSDLDTSINKESMRN